MPKEYTDYVIMVLHSGQRLYHLGHFWNRMGSDINHKAFPYHGHRYLLDLNRAYKVSWAPWRKGIWTEKRKKKVRKGVVTWRTSRWFRPGKTLYELLRPKKIGLLIYQEPDPPVMIKTLVDASCSCGFKGKTMPGTKTHIARSGQGHDLEPVYDLVKSQAAKEPIEPMHISRIHQPSGVMKG